MSGGKRSGLGASSPDIDDLLGVGVKKTGAKRGSAAAAPAKPGRSKTLSGGRFLLICCVFTGVMLAALAKFADMAAQGGAAPEPAVAAGFVNREKAADLAKDDDAEPQRAPRAPITDRNGAPLARDVATYELYLDREAFAFPDELEEAAQTLAAAFPRRFGADTLLAKLKKRRTTLLARPLTAREAQRAHDLGVPGLYLTPRFDRVYPAGAITAHAVGFVDVDGAGQAGVEAALDRELKATADEPLRLSLDLRIQHATRRALAEAREAMAAPSAAAVVMDVETGELLALVSLPDFDPNALPPQPKTPEEQERSPLFHRAVVGRYELGSVLKIVTWALALERGVAFMGDAFEPLPPLAFGDHEIPWDGGADGASLPAAFARSLNRVAAELGLRAGRSAQKRMFDALGLTKASPIEVGEASLGAPEAKKHWGEVDTAAASYGYGVEMSPAHMASALATLVNGGELVRPTLLKRTAPAAPRKRVVGAETSRRMRELLRLAVTDGTGRRADVPGLRVGGKTGTARKLVNGVYDENRTRASFAAAFPIDRPKLALVVALDEPQILVNGELKRSASYTAAPAAGAIIRAIAPLAGVAPAAGKEGEPAAPLAPSAPPRVSSTPPRVSSAPPRVSSAPVARPVPPAAPRRPLGRIETGDALLRQLSDAEAPALGGIY